MVTELPSNVTIGGTGILIVVGVAIETYKQIESSLTARSFYYLVLSLTYHLQV